MSELPYAAETSSHDSFQESKHENWLINTAGLGLFAHGRIHQEGHGGIFVSDPLHKRGEMATDDVLKMEEQALDSMGDPLTVPSRMGELKALAVLPEMKSANGEGDVIAYYEDGVVAFNTFLAPRESRVNGQGEVTQKGWSFQRMVSTLLNTVSAVSRYAVTVMPRDHFFRSVYGLHFLKRVLGDESDNPEHVHTLSAEVQPLLDKDDPSAMDGAATGIWLKGSRLFASTGLHRSECHSATGMAKGFISLNQATSYTDDHTPRPLAEGVWVLDNGMQGLHQFSGLGLQQSDRSYGFLASDRDSELYFATLRSNFEEDRRDCEWIPIEWSCETGSFMPNRTSKSKLEDGVLKGVFSQTCVQVRVLVRTDRVGRWGVWHEFKPRDPSVKDCPSFLHNEPLGQPPKEYREAAWFQFRIEGVGYAEIHDLQYAAGDAGSNAGQNRRVEVTSCDENPFLTNDEGIDSRWPVRLLRKPPQPVLAPMVFATPQMPAVCDPTYVAVAGPRGESAYQSYVSTTKDNPVLTKEQWAAARAAELPEWLGAFDSIKVENAQLVLTLGGKNYRINALEDET